MIRLAIASDLHAYSGQRRPKPSFLGDDVPEAPVSQNAIASLLARIHEDKITADALICPGDLGDRADPGGITFAWRKLHDLAEALHCDGNLITTAGNHDIDSRFTGNNHAPDHILKSLQPQFPCLDDNDANKYWARTFNIRSFAKFRAVVLNSSAYHGYRGEDNEGNPHDESRIGRIDEQAIERLESELNSSDNYQINIVVCHHCPHSFGEAEPGEGLDVMRLGQKLLDMLARIGKGSWLVIHGHKHRPKIGLAAGPASAPIVFSAASLSAYLTNEFGNLKNQFHVIEIHEERYHDLGLVGTVQSWDWSIGNGWSPSTGCAGLPGKFGFGLRSIAGLPDRIKTEVPKSHPIRWDQLCQRVPELNYAMPLDVPNLINQSGLAADSRADGSVSEVYWL